MYNQIIQNYMKESSKAANTALLIKEQNNISTDSKGDILRNLSNDIAIKIFGDQHIYGQV